MLSRLKYKRERQAKLEGQVLIIVMLIATICLIIVAGLALRTARRIREARRAREYQIAYGQALSGLEAMSAAIAEGIIDGLPLDSCDLNSPCYLTDGGANQGYEVSVYAVENNYVDIPKDRAIDLWLPEVNNATTVSFACLTSCGGAGPGVSKGITSTVITENAGVYSEQKASLSCVNGSVWGFDSCTLAPGGEECSTSQAIGAGMPRLVRVKAFVDGGSCVSVYAAALTGGGGIVASTGGFRIDATGYGYDDVTATISVIVTPSGLPYPFDFSLYDG